MGLVSQLRNVVEFENYSRNSLGSAIGVDQSSLAKWMRGERGLSADAIEKLFDYLGLDLVNKISYAEWRNEQWNEGYSDYDQALVDYLSDKELEWNEYQNSDELRSEFLEWLDGDEDEDGELWDQFISEAEAEWSLSYDTDHKDDHFQEWFDMCNEEQWPNELRDYAEGFTKQTGIHVEVDWTGAGCVPEMSE